MTNEISIFYDRELNKKVEEAIIFGPIIAGETSEKEIYLYNNLEWVANLNVSIEGENVEIIKNVAKIKPSSSEVLKLSIKPKLTAMKPIKVKLNIKVEYIVE